MKKSNLKVLALLISFVMLLSACSSSPTPTITTPPSTGGDSTGNESTGTPSPDTDTPAGLEPITFTFFNSDLAENEPFNNAVAKKITELTGVTLKFDYAVGGTYEERIALMIGSHDYPDLIFAKAEVPKLVENGALLVLDDYIETRGGNIKTLYGDYLPRIRMSVEDPHYYTLGVGGIGQVIWDTKSWYPIQHAVLKDAGYPKLETLEDVEKLLADYVAKYPEIDGLPTIPLSLDCDDWHWIIDLGNPSGLIGGILANGEWDVNADTLDAQYKYVAPQVKDYFRWLNHMYDIGLLDSESFTQKEDTFFAKIANGQVLSILSPEWECGEALVALRGSGKLDRLYAQLPITLYPGQVPTDSYDEGWSGGWGVGITTSCKNPDRAFDFLNWWASDEAQVLLNWGIEGEHYDIKDGKRVQKPEVFEQSVSDPDFQRKTGIGRYVHPFPQYGDGKLDPNGETYTPKTADFVKAAYTDEDKATMSAYGVNMWSELFPPASTWPLSPFGKGDQVNIPAESDLTLIMKQMSDYTQTMLPKITTTSPEKFDAVWDEYMAELKNLGVDEANAEFTALVKAKAEFWKK